MAVFPIHQAPLVTFCCCCFDTMQVRVKLVAGPWQRWLLIDQAVLATVKAVARRVCKLMDNVGTVRTSCRLGNQL